MYLEIGFAIETANEFTDFYSFVSLLAGKHKCEVVVGEEGGGGCARVIVV